MSKSSLSPKMIKSSINTYDAEIEDVLKEPVFHLS